MTTMNDSNIHEEKSDFLVNNSDNKRSNSIDSHFLNKKNHFSVNIIDRNFTGIIKSFSAYDFSALIKDFTHNQTFFICKPLKHKEEDVSEDFIKDFNDHIGNFENIQKAKRLLRKMRQLGGLEQGMDPKNIDIPSARRGLCMLTGLSHLDLKLAAMDSLLELLHADELRIETATGIVELGADLVKRMNRDLMQTELIETQKKIASVYNIVAELIQRNYGKKYIGGITAELRTELIQTARALEALNTHEDTELHFIVKSALEGVKRLRDDRKELFELLERIFHGLLACMALYYDNSINFSDQLEKTFGGIDLRIKHGWYDGALILNELSKKAKKDPAALMIMQGFIHKKFRKTNWKFLYGAIRHFEDIALHGESYGIRRSALAGHKIISKNFPGILNFTDCSAFHHKANMRPIVHLKKTPPNRSKYSDSNGVHT